MCVFGLLPSCFSDVCSPIPNVVHRYWTIKKTLIINVLTCTTSDVAECSVLWTTVRVHWIQPIHSVYCAWCAWLQSSVFLFAILSLWYILKVRTFYLELWKNETCKRTTVAAGGVCASLSGSLEAQSGQEHFRRLTNPIHFVFVTLY